MLSPKELAKLEKQPLSGVSYHVRVLVKCGAIEEAGDRRVRGSIEHFYLPTDLVRKTPWVLATLGLKAERWGAKENPRRPKSADASART